MTDIEIVEIGGGGLVELAYEPPDVLAGAEIVSVASGASQTGGAQASPGRIESVAIAGVAVSGHRVVTPNSAGVVYADNALLAHAGRALWLTLGAAANGAPVAVALTGQVDEPSWTWALGPVYLGASGLLTQTPPSKPAAAFLAVIGIATSATSLHVDRQPSIVLT